MKPTSRIASTFLTTLGLLALGTLPLFAQDSAAAPKAEGNESVIQTILHGGPLIVLIWIAIVATSIVMVTFVVQNFLYIRKDKLAPPALVESLQNSINGGNYQEAWETCSANDNYLANVVRRAMERLGRGKEAVEDGIAESALREAQVIRVRNSYLSVIGVVSPMIGLLGTVIGMLNAFGKLGSSGTNDPRGLATAIGEVLMATASGLFIAIPAFIFYYFFRNRSQTCIVYADDAVNDLVAEIPFEELRGIRIGENFNPGVGGAVSGAAQSRKVSVALTTNCPVCNGSVTPGENPCPHCGATLEWS